MFSRRFIPRLAVSCLVSAPFALPAAYGKTAAGTGAASRPNIIFVLVDDMGWGDLACNWDYGKKFSSERARAPHFKTPTLDKMAAEGVILFRHYSACPVSAPARASLMTGVHQGHERQVRDNTFDTPIPDVHTLGSVLKEAGYATAAVGKWGLGGVGDGPLEHIHPVGQRRPGHHVLPPPVVFFCHVGGVGEAVGRIVGGDGGGGHHGDFIVADAADDVVADKGPVRAALSPVPLVAGVEPLVDFVLFKHAPASQGCFVVYALFVFVKNIFRKHGHISLQ